MSKIPVYFMPGLAASPMIFERIHLPENQFDVHLLDWEIPFEKETLKAYAQRMASKVTHQDVVLIGVSFGGVLVQEMAQFLKVKKVIIISSIKSNLEMPITMKVAKTTKVYKLFPTRMANNLDLLSKFSFGTLIKRRIKLYQKYLSVREKSYLDWAIEQMVQWSRTEIDPKVIHIHGDADAVFPIKYINNCIVVKGGTHIMILSKYKWFNANLPEIIIK